MWRNSRDEKGGTKFRRYVGNGWDLKTNYVRQRGFGHFQLPELVVKPFTEQRGDKMVSSNLSIDF